MKITKRVLTATNYTYLEPKNAERVRAKGKEWGSSSVYINFLIAKDHGDKKSMELSKEQMKIFLTPPTARLHREKEAKKVKKVKKVRKAGKRKAGKSGLVKAKRKGGAKTKRGKSSASRAKSAKKRAASSRPTSAVKSSGEAAVA